MRRVSAARWRTLPLMRYYWTAVTVACCYSWLCLLRLQVALFYFEDTGQKSPCYLQYYQMTYLAQQAGSY